MAAAPEAGRLLSMSRTRKPKTVVGWREWVQLPDMSSSRIKAKIDTGAATSSLHAFDLHLVERDSETWAEFEVHPVQRSKANTTRVSAPVTGFRRVRSSSGHSERRPVVVSSIRIGEDEFSIEITLTRRDDMGFRMLLGRSALRTRYMVDPARSYLRSQDRRIEDAK